MNEKNRVPKRKQKMNRDISLKSAEGSDKKMKITDLPIDCLQEIFEYLDLENLLNVADSNKRLNIAACFVFRRKHGKKRADLEGKKYKCNLVHVDEKYDDRITVGGVTHCYRFLRCFGCVISSLTINFYKIPQSQVDKICFYINEYCAESLIKLEIFRMKTFVNSFSIIQKPFVNIETLAFWYSNLGTNITKFNKWFPKMRNLKLIENQMVEKECIEMNFPNLTNLLYHPKRSDKENFLSHLENVIRLNPEIRSLYLLDWSEKLLQNISNYLPQLEELRIDGRLLNSEPDYVSGQVNFKNLKKLEFAVKNRESLKLLLKINFVFDQLEEFHEYGNTFINLRSFVRKYLTIKKLSMSYHHGYDMSTENALEVAKVLPLLSELHLKLKRNLCIDEIIRFVDELKQLKKFHFEFDHQSDVDDLRKKFCKDWKVSISVWFFLKKSI